MLAVGVHCQIGHTDSSGQGDMRTGTLFRSRDTTGRERIEPVSTGSNSFALNHMAAPSLGYRAFIDLAASLGCVGVEFRNDFAGQELFDGASAREVKTAAADAGLRILALSEVKRFNDGLPERRDQAEALIETAVECGAEAVMCGRLRVGKGFLNDIARARIGVEY